MKNYSRLILTKRIFILGVSLLITTNAFSQIGVNNVFDLEDTLVQRINTKHPPGAGQNYERVINPGLIGNSGFQTRARGGRKGWTFDLRLINGQMILGDSINRISEAIFRRPFKIYQRQSTPFKEEFEWEVKIQEGFEITYTTTITSSQTIEGTVNIGGEVGTKTQSLSFGASKKREVENTVEVVDGSSFKKIRTETKTFPKTIEVPSGYCLEAEYKIEQAKEYQDYTGWVLLDGTASCSYWSFEKHGGKDQWVQRDKRWDLSDLLSQDDRTIPINGTFSNIDVEAVVWDVAFEIPCDSLGSKSKN